jgi:flagellar motor switch protein FliM
LNSTSQTSAAPQQIKSRTVIDCNFRAAGRFSNEDARALSALQATFARFLASALDAYLGTETGVKLQMVDRLPARACIEGIVPQTYIVPLTVDDSDIRLFAVWDNAVVLPLLELLMGGSGAAQSGEWDASEIEEEILAGVMQLLARQAEIAWSLDHESLMVKGRVKASELEQHCAAKEKVATIRFDVAVAGVVGTLQLVLSSALLGTLLKQSKTGPAQKRGNMRQFPTPGIRERILDCDMEVTAELPGLRVAVRDLIALQPGSVLKLRAPVQQPGTLTAGGRGVFEAIPVRTGSQRAAQLGRRNVLGDWK